MAQEHILDARDLAAPEPLQRALAELDVLPTGDFLRLRLARNPVLLYAILRMQEFEFITRSYAQESYEVLIWRRGDAVAEKGARAQAE